MTWVRRGLSTTGGLVVYNEGVHGTAIPLDLEIAIQEAAKQQVALVPEALLSLVEGLLGTDALAASLAGQFNLADEFGIYGCAICESDWKQESGMPSDPKTGATLTPPTWRHSADCVLVKLAEEITANQKGA